MVQLGFIFLYFGILILIKFLSKPPSKPKYSSQRRRRYNHLGAGLTVLWFVLWNSGSIHYVTSPFGMMLLLCFVPTLIAGLIVPFVQYPRLRTHETDMDYAHQGGFRFQSSKPERDDHYLQIDSLLNHLNGDERAYLERKLGAGELILGNDGELLTLEEYRQRQRGGRG